MCLRDAASRAGCRFSRRFPFPQLFLSSMVGFRKLEMSLFGKPFKFHPHPSCIPCDGGRVPSSAWVSLTPRLFARIDSGWGKARKSVFIQELRRTTEMERDWNRTIFNRSARFSAHLAPLPERTPPPFLLHIANRIRSLLDISRNPAYLAPSVLSYVEYAAAIYFDQQIARNFSRINRSPR